MPGTSRKRAKASRARKKSKVFSDRRAGKERRRRKTRKASVPRPDTQFEDPGFVFAGRGAKARERKFGETSEREVLGLEKGRTVFRNKRVKKERREGQRRKRNSIVVVNEKDGNFRSFPNRDKLEEYLATHPRARNEKNREFFLVSNIYRRSFRRQGLKVTKWLGQDKFPVYPERRKPPLPKKRKSARKK